MKVISNPIPGRWYKAPEEIPEVGVKVLVFYGEDKSPSYECCMIEAPEEMGLAWWTWEWMLLGDLEMEHYWQVPIPPLSQSMEKN